MGVAPHYSRQRLETSPDRRADCRSNLVFSGGPTHPASCLGPLDPRGYPAGEQILTTTLRQPVARETDQTLRDD